MPIFAATAGSPRWSVDGTVLPRNPDSTPQKQYDKSLVQYVTMANGLQRRLIPPNTIPGCDITLEWHNADQRLKNAIMQFFGNPRLLRKITMDGLLPPRQMYAYFDTPAWAIAKDTIDRRLGQGGFRQDLKVTLRSDGPYDHSLNPVPSALSTALPTAAQVQAWFGGPTGNNAIDGLPTWNGNPWQVGFNNGVAVNFSNLGTAPWSPVIRFVGPFNSSLTVTQTYMDLDGTGAGTAFTYSGPAVASGDYLLWDTQNGRLWQVVSGAKSEIWAFSVNLVSSGTPAPYWPPFPSGNFSLTVSNASGVLSIPASTLDLSNAGTETFRYW